MNSKRSLLTRVLLVLAVIIVANILLTRLFFRLDFTGDKRYTLSNPTKQILKELEDPVTVSAYFSDDLPPQIAGTKTEFQALLEEYNKRSNGSVVYEFINPNENEETEKAAMEAGIQPITLSVRERDQAKQQRAYLGAVINYGNNKEVLPVIQPGVAMEYALTSSIKKIADSDKPKIGFVQGHGEPALQELSQAYATLSVLFDLQPVTLDTLTIENYKGLAIVSPKDSFQQAELSKLDALLGSGKGLFLALNRVEADLQQSRGMAISTGLEGWLSAKGIDVEEKFIIDQKCGSVTVQQQTGFFTFNRPIPFPFLPIIQSFGDHPIASGLEQALLQFASPLNYDNVADGITVSPLAFSSDKSGTSPTPTFFDINKEWDDVDFPSARLPIAAAFEGNISGNIPSRMVVIGDGDFAVNGQGQGARQIGQDEISLLANSIEWLNDDSGLSELRTKEITSRPIKKELTDGQKTSIKWFNFLLPLVGIAIFGLIRFTLRRRRKNKWRDTRYV